MAVDISATLFRSEQDILRLDITISYQGIIMKILKTICNLCENEPCNSFAHIGTLRHTKRLEFFFLCQFIREVGYDTRVDGILLGSFVPVCNLTKVSKLHH